MKEKTRTHLIEEIEDEEDNRRPTMCVEYVYAYNAQSFVSIATTSIDQFKLTIYHYMKL